MKKDEFGPLYEGILQSATDEGTGGVSTRQLAEQTGSSRQRAYAWVDNNRARLRVVGKTREGAAKFVFASADEPAAQGSIGQGSRLLVRNVRWQGGLVLELELDDGSVVVADIRQ